MDLIKEIRKMLFEAELPFEKPEPKKLVPADPTLKLEGDVEEPKPELELPIGDVETEKEYLGKNEKEEHYYLVNDGSKLEVLDAIGEKVFDSEEAGVDAKDMKAFLEATQNKLKLVAYDPEIVEKYITKPAEEEMKKQEQDVTIEPQDGAIMPSDPLPTPEEKMKEDLIPISKEGGIADEVNGEDELAIDDEDGEIVEPGEEVPDEDLDLFNEEEEEDLVESLSKKYKLIESFEAGDDVIYSGKLKKYNGKKAKVVAVSPKGLAAIKFEDGAIYPQAKFDSLKKVDPAFPKREVGTSDVFDAQKSYAMPTKDRKVAESVSGSEAAEVAKVIASQLGGVGKLKAMLGAHSFSYDTEGMGSLVFKFKGAKDNIKAVKITLNGKDLYDVKFYSIRGIDVKTAKEVNDVYAEDLKDLFQDTTGLYLSLGTMGKGQSTPEAQSGQEEAPEGLKEGKECPECNGSGNDEAEPSEECVACGGSGRYEDYKIATGSKVNEAEENTLTRGMDKEKWYRKFGFGSKVVDDKNGKFMVMAGGKDKYFLTEEEARKYFESLGDELPKHIYSYDPKASPKFKELERAYPKSMYPKKWDFNKKAEEQDPEELKKRDYKTSFGGFGNWDKYEPGSYEEYMASYKSSQDKKDNVSKPEDMEFGTNFQRGDFVIAKEDLAMEVEGESEKVDISKGEEVEVEDSIMSDGKETLTIVHKGNLYDIDAKYFTKDWVAEGKLPKNADDSEDTIKTLYEKYIPAVSKFIVPIVTHKAVNYKVFESRAEAYKFTQENKLNPALIDIVKVK